MPTAIFYAVLFASGNTMDSMREAKWFGPEFEAFTFYEQLEVFYGAAFRGDVEWAALAAGLPSWIIMILIVCLDDMLKLASTETALKIDLDYPREMKVIAPD